MDFLSALLKLCDNIELSMENLRGLIKNNTITQNTCRNGREVLWYLDDNYDVAIYLDTLDFLSDEEKNEQL